MYKNLRAYLELLERRGELTRVQAPVDAIEEIAEITDRVTKAGGNALLFENTGTEFPVVINMFGSDSRMAAALGAESLDDIPERIERLIAGLLSPKGAVSEKIATIPLLGQASRWFPHRSRRRGKCQQIVLTGEDAKLSILPILKCWPHDGGRFITLPLVNTIDPDTGARNVGMYRMQVMDNHTTGMHWHRHKTGARHYEAYKRRGERMPVSVCIGGDPVYTYSAVAPMPDGLDEYLLAGFLRGRAVKLVKSVTNDIMVPADCDFVIEGYVDPSEEKVIEGPFGDHTGFYSLEDLYPLFHVEAITHRKDAVWPATIVGIPPQEDLYMAKATEKIFLAPIRLVMQPEMTDMYMPAEGVAHNLAIVDINKRYPGQADKVASSLWGAGQMMFNKYLLITSGVEDIRNPETISRLLRGVDMPGAIIRGQGVLDILDHATATPGEGGKLALDFTESDPEAASRYAWRSGKSEIRPVGGIESCDDSLTADWGILIVRAGAESSLNIQKFIDANGIDNAKIIAIVDNATEILTPSELLWLVTSNSDPARDAELVGGTLIIDGRTKLPGKEGNPKRFPNVVTSSPQTIALVDRRWTEYGLGDFIASPSARYIKLLMSDKAEI